MKSPLSPGLSYHRPGVSPTDPLALVSLKILLTGIKSACINFGYPTRAGIVKNEHSASRSLWKCNTPLSTVAHSGHALDSSAYYTFLLDRLKHSSRGHQECGAGILWICVAPRESA